MIIKVNARGLRLALLVGAVFYLAAAADGESKTAPAAAPPAAATPTTNAATPKTPATAPTPNAAKPPGNPTNPPGHWEVYPSPTTANLLAVSFVDANDGWAVGYGTPGGAILRYQNGTWSVFKYYNGTDYRQFGDIDMVSHNDGWLVCFNGWAYRGEIWHWDGVDWTLFQPNSGYLSCIDMIDADHGWVGDNPTFLRYDGSSWVFGGSAADTIYGIDMESDTAGRAVGGHYVYRRTGGVWETEVANNNWILGDVSMINSSTGWSSGYEVTSDKGFLVYFNGSWQVYKVFNEAESIARLDVYGNDFGWCVGWLYSHYPYGGFLAYFDGTNWFTVNAPTDQGLRGVDIIDKNNGWIVGDNGVILKYYPNVGIRSASLGKIKASYR